MEALIEVDLDSVSEPAVFPEIFGQEAPVEIDLGCGDGAFLADLAAQRPDRNFLGVEKLRGRVGSACRKITQAGLPNARLVRLNIFDAISRLCQPGSVSAFYLLFPDPWPKRRHYRRRTFTTAFTQAVCRALRPDGFWHIATDDAAYFEQMKLVLALETSFRTVENLPPLLPTTFERKFAERHIYRLSLRKVSPVR